MQKKPLQRIKSFDGLSALKFETNVTGSSYSRKTHQPLKLSRGQEMLLNVALKGVGALEPEQEHKLTDRERREITLLSNRACRILQYLKTQAITNTIASLFKKLFPAAPKTHAQDILLKPLVDSGYVPVLSLKELGINRERMVEALIRHGVLPENYWKLSSE